MCFACDFDDPPSFHFIEISKSSHQIISQIHWMTCSPEETLYIVHFIRFYESYKVIWLHLCSSSSCVSPSVVQIHGFNFIWNFINSKIPSKCHYQWGGPCLHRTQEIRSLSRDKSIVFIYKVLRRGKSINELSAQITWTGPACSVKKRRTGKWSVRQATGWLELVSLTWLLKHSGEDWSFSLTVVGGWSADGKQLSLIASGVPECRLGILEGFCPWKVRSG